MWIQSTKSRVDTPDREKLCILVKEMSIDAVDQGPHASQKRYSGLYLETYKTKTTANKTMTGRILKTCIWLLKLKW